MTRQTTLVIMGSFLASLCVYWKHRKHTRRIYSGSWALVSGFYLVWTIQEKVMERTRFLRACETIDRMHGADPRRDRDGTAVELAYAASVTSWIYKLNPNPSVCLLLTARCQHLERWLSPRLDFPQGRDGYLKWRIEKRKRQRQKCAVALKEAGFSRWTEARVAILLSKKSLGSGDPEAQHMADAACLVFLEKQAPSLLIGQEEKIIVDIIQKTWHKMSEEGRQLALTIKHSTEMLRMIREALHGSGACLGVAIGTI